jgi:hypothetical protein
MNIVNLIHHRKQKASARCFVLAAAVAMCFTVPAHAQNGLDAGGLTFKDFGVADRGASFDRTTPLSSGVPDSTAAHLLEADNSNGLARIRFETVKIEAAIPLGWQAVEDPERGVAYNGDQSYRLIFWRVDFPFEGVADAAHYASTKSGTIMARKPGVRAQARKLPDGSFLIVYENVPPTKADHEPRTVFDLVSSNPGNAKQGVLMTLGVPTSQADRGLRLVSLLQQNMKISW